jgi:cobalt-precorrin-5B (C1)-methyltransferase
MLDMGDFAGGLLRYLRRHPVERLTIGGGFAKLTKLGAGALDLHSGRSQVDFGWLAARVAEGGGSPGLVALAGSAANTALQVLEAAAAEGVPVADVVAGAARRTALDVLDGAPVTVDVVVVDRQGTVVGTSPVAATT